MEYKHELVERINTALDLYDKLEAKNSSNWDQFRDLLAMYINKQVETATMILGIEYK